MEQVQGLWKVKNQSMSDLYEEAKKLMSKFLSVKINHVLRVCTIQFVFSMLYGSSYELCTTHIVYRILIVCYTRL